ncbi:aminotransferase class III-fold pyridoxal phosphate-dependent enzyme [Gulosibacter faecalis]|uniref:Aminotransferase class III-fold pyridoxal phosphate-dependent enzyme n=1 Tax=Gulosibacter faecalis TaxID=272240 RepID=A0ABW5UYQ6_9MICO|nr:aminotransferase class III-fold pyridoxal phosphate-dependent enzyme [Gulosibacter faecalis]
MANSHWERIRPDIDEAHAQRLLAEHYGLRGATRELGSQQDRNFLVTTEAGDRFVLKVDHPATTEPQLDAQHAAMSALRAAGLVVPEELPTVAGEQRARLALADSNDAHLRLFEYLDGGTLADSNVFGEFEARLLGEAAGRSVAALARTEHPGFRETAQWDLRRGADVVRSLVVDVIDSRRRAAVDEAVMLAERALEAIAERLPVQPIHGDLTDDNVLALDRAPGIIDFGDVGDGWRIGELAVAIASILQRTGSLAFVAAALEEFAEHVDFTDAELEALWPLVTLRGAVLVASGANQLRIDAGNAYARERAESEWQVLEAALAVPFDEARSLLRLALGRAHLPGLRYERLLPQLRRGHTLALDAESAVFDEGAWLEPGTVSSAIERALDEHELVTTRYGEWRLDMASAPATAAPENRALFVDLISATGGDLFAPFPGDVEVLDHETLDLVDGAIRLRIRGVYDSHSGWVAAGGRLGSLATEIDGTPRARVQLIAGRGGEVLDWASTETLGELASMRPDPSPILGLAPAPSPMPALRDERRRRAKALGNASERFWQEPPLIVRGWGSYLIDHTARPLLDLVNNVAAVGHSHPRLDRAAHSALTRLNTNSRFLYRGYADFTERLVERANRAWPGEFDVAVPVNSGSEAIDLALRLARAFTGRETIVVPREAYHGWTFASDAISTSSFDNPGSAENRPDWVRLVTPPNAYRGPFADADGYLEELESLLETTESPVAAFITESVLGNAGGVVPPEGYLRRAFAAVRAHGGVAIADEVQVGYGRLGSNFWGASMQGARPDIITVAKAAGGGYPLGAVITRREVLDALAREGMFFSSAAGSPLSSAIGSEVLDIIDDEGLMGRAERVGRRFTEAMHELAQRHDWVGAVHGRGLYQGVELVRDRASKTPAPDETQLVCERMLRHGMIVQPASERQNVLKFKPPMTITEFDVEQFASALDVELGRLAR